MSNFKAYSVAEARAIVSHLCGGETAEPFCVSLFGGETWLVGADRFSGCAVRLRSDADAPRFMSARRSRLFCDALQRPRQYAGTLDAASLLEVCLWPEDWTPLLTYGGQTTAPRVRALLTDDNDGQHWPLSRTGVQCPWPLELDCEREVHVDMRRVLDALLCVGDHARVYTTPDMLVLQPAGEASLREGGLFGFVGLFGLGDA